VVVALDDKKEVAADGVIHAAKLGVVDKLRQGVLSVCKTGTGKKRL
jgi:hypothetical protein